MMNLRHVQCLIFITNLLFSSGNSVKEPEDSSRFISASATSPASSIQKSAVNSNEEVPNSALQERIVLPRPQDDIVTPIPTVPAINPSNPATPMATPSTTNPINPNATPSMGMPSPSSGLSWCIASLSASQTSLQVALDYACGYGGADCSQIQPGGSCFNPDTVQNHASYAFNDYYLKNPILSSCDFGGIIRNERQKKPFTAGGRHAFASTSKPPASSKLILKIIDSPEEKLRMKLKSVYSQSKKK